MKLATLLALTGLALGLVAPLAGPVAAQGMGGHPMLELAARPATEADRAKARSVLPSDPRRQLDYVRPQDTDPRISQFLQDHVVITYPGKSKGQVLVFLPGTFARPVGAELFLDTAARAGYRAIGLEYVDASLNGGPSTIMAACGHGGDMACPGSIRTARALGGQGADGNTVPAPDAIVSRLTMLLKYLDRTHPNAGWAAFVAGDQPNWAKIALAGHSQGAGMAAFLARKYPVARVVLLSGGADGNPRTRQAADWVNQPSATPPDRWYAMADASEPQVQAMVAGLAILGVSGQPLNWTAGGLNGAHIALVDLDPRNGGKHESTATDLATPLAGDGTPAYAPLWSALLGR